MKSQTPYRYSILRYMYDVRTQEFLNVGILFHAPQEAFLRFRGIEKTGRLSGTFPGINPQDVLHSLTRFADEFARAEETAQDSTIELIRSAVLPKDDSSFQWAPSGGGLSDDIMEALDSAFLRYVGRYERKSVKRVRSDADVWGVLRTELVRRQVLERLHSAKITTPLRSYHFQHSWQNRQLHALKPFSLDGADGDEIADKASHWAGVMRDLSRSNEQFQLHLIVGEPRQTHLRNSFASARDLLRDCADGRQLIVHDEQDAGNLAEQIARDVAHTDNDAV
jgi:hypothetical protein